MLIMIAKTIFFFVFILAVSTVVFSTLTRLIGKFFNVTIAQDSVVAKTLTKIRSR